MKDDGTYLLLMILIAISVFINIIWMGGGDDSIWSVVVLPLLIITALIIVFIIFTLSSDNRNEFPIDI